MSKQEQDYDYEDYDEVVETCHRCGTTVDLQPCPYDIELGNGKDYDYCCSKCARECAADV